jgi:hypothetical protein
VEALPLKNIEAAMCKDAFLAGWVACFGMPATVTTDRGTQFTSSTWKSMYDQFNIKHALTTSFHPQRESTGRSRMPYVHKRGAQHGCSTFRGCS